MRVTWQGRSQQLGGPGAALPRDQPALSPAPLGLSVLLQPGPAGCWGTGWAGEDPRDGPAMAAWCGCQEETGRKCEGGD